MKKPKCAIFNTLRYLRALLLVFFIFISVYYLADVIFRIAQYSHEIKRDEVPYKILVSHPVVENRNGRYFMRIESALAQSTEIELAVMPFYDVDELLSAVDGKGGCFTLSERYSDKPFFFVVSQTWANDLHEIYERMKPAHCMLYPWDIHFRKYRHLAAFDNRYEDFLRLCIYEFRQMFFTTTIDNLPDKVVTGHRYESSDSFFVKMDEQLILVPSYYFTGSDNQTAPLVHVLNNPASKHEFIEYETIDTLMIYKDLFFQSSNYNLQFVRDSSMSYSVYLIENH